MMASLCQGCPNNLLRHNESFPQISVVTPRKICFLNLSAWIYFWIFSLFCRRAHASRTSSYKEAFLSYSVEMVWQPVPIVTLARSDGIDGPLPRPLPCGLHRLPALVVRRGSLHGPLVPRKTRNQHRESTSLLLLLLLAVHGALSTERMRRLPPRQEESCRLRRRRIFGRGPLRFPAKGRIAVRTIVLLCTVVAIERIGYCRARNSDHDDAAVLFRDRYGTGIAGGSSPRAICATNGGSEALNKVRMHLSLH